MARVPFKSTPGGLLLGRQGRLARYRDNVTLTLTGGTLFAEATGATPYSGPLKTNIDGEGPGWLEPGLYTATDTETGEGLVFEVGGASSGLGVLAGDATGPLAASVVERVRGKNVPAPGAAQDQMTWKYDHGTGAMVWVPLVAGAGGGTLFVAASNASAVIKARADYVCDGFADNVEIQAAIDAFGSGTSNGGRTECSDGNFNIAATVNPKRDGAALVGQGTNTGSNGGTTFTAAAGLTGAVIKVEEGPGATRPVAGAVLRDFVVNGNNVGSGVHGVHFRSHRGLIDHVHVYNATGDGFLLEGYSGWSLYDTVSDHLLAYDCAGAGLHLKQRAEDQHVSNSTFASCGYGIRNAGASNQFDNVHCFGNDEHGFWWDGNGSRSIVIGSKFEENQKHGMFFDGTTAGVTDVKVVGCGFKNNGYAAANTYDHISMGGSGQCLRPTIVGCNFSVVTGEGSPTPRYAIKCDGAFCAQVNIQANNFQSGLWGTGAMPVFRGGATGIIAGNQGFLTENSGTSTQTPGAVTTVNIPHGLAVTPTSGQVTPGDADARGAPAYHITFTATNIVLTFAAALTAATEYVWAWSARKDG